MNIRSKYSGLTLTAALITTVCAITLLVQYFLISNQPLFPAITATATVTLRPTTTTTKVPVATFTALPQVVSGDNILVQQELQDLQREVIALQQQVDTLAQNNKNSIKDSEIKQLQDSINTLSQRLEAIETVILNNPAKALEITLLRQEIDNLQLSYQQDLNSTRVEIDRIYDLSKWFLGLILTMALSLVSLVVTDYLKANKPNDIQKSSVKSDKRT